MCWRKRKGKRKIGIVLGAGASMGARSHLSPPSGPQLLHRLKQFLPDVIALGRDKISDRTRDNLIRLQGELSGALANFSNYEGLFRCLYAKCEVVPSPSDTARDLRILSALYFLKNDAPPTPFIETEDKYDDLAKSVIELTLRETLVSIVTLNYDVLLEEAFRRLSKLSNRVHLRRIEVDRSHVDSPFTVDLYKPHGSADWGRNQNVDSVSMLDEADTLEGTSDNGFTVQSDRGSQLIVLLHKEGDPIMADYCDSKSSPNNQSTLDKIRDHYNRTLATLDAVYVSGVNPVFDDNVDAFVSKAVFGPPSARRTTVYAYHMAEELKCELTRRQFKVIEGDFEKFLADLKEKELRS